MLQARAQKQRYVRLKSQYDIFYFELHWSCFSGHRDGIPALNRCTDDLGTLESSPLMNPYMSKLTDVQY